MRKLIFCALLLGALTACEHVELSPTVIEEEGGVMNYAKKFTFTVKGDFTNPEFSGSGTRANSYMTADGVEMTDLWVLDVVDENPDHDAESWVIKQQLHQVSSDADWGAPSMSLTLGTHHVMFLASRGTGASYDGGVVTWTRMNDTFYKDYEVTVVKTSNGNRAVTLDRVATRLSLVIEDAIPAGTTTISLAPTKWYTGWNMLTGEPVQSNSYVAAYNLTAAYIGTTNLTLNMWGLSGADEWQTNVDVTAKADDATTAYITIPDAPLKANRTTSYRGNLFTNSTAHGVSLHTEWLPAYEGVY